jgi:hypothetical protein
MVEDIYQDINFFRNFQLIFRVRPASMIEANAWNRALLIQPVEI